MKRIKAACITPTLCFFNHDQETTEYAKRAIVQEYESINHSWKEVAQNIKFYPKLQM